MALTRTPTTMIRHVNGSSNPLLSDLLNDLSKGRTAWLSVKDFGAVGNGIVDDSPAFQAAINAASAGYAAGDIFAPGARVYVPTGKYRLNSTISIQAPRVDLVGDGKSSILIPGMSSGNVIELGNFGYFITNNILQGFRINSIDYGGAAMSGNSAAIVVRRTNGALISDIRIDGYPESPIQDRRISSGIRIYGGSDSYNLLLNNLDLDKLRRRGIEIVRDGAEQFVQNVFVNNCKIGGCGEEGIFVEHVSGLYITSSEILGSKGNGIAFYPREGCSAQFILIDHAIVDTCGSYGVLASEAAGGSVYDIQISASWMSSNDESGIGITSGTSTVQLVGNKIANNKKHGIFIDGQNTRNVVVTGNICSYNSKTHNGVYHGIYVNSPRVTVTGNSSGIGHIYEGSETNPQGFGVYADGGCQDAVVVGNVCIGNYTGGIYNGGVNTRVGVNTSPDTVFTNMNAYGLGIGTTAAPLFAGKGIALGDSDTGIRQNGDGLLEICTQNSPRWGVGPAGNMAPMSDNAYSFGTPSNRTTQVYAVSGSINTSDEEEKQDIVCVDDHLLDAWADVSWFLYRWRDAVAIKGEDARIHAGAVAQRIQQTLEAHGLDPFRFGLLCRDEYENGSGTYRYGLRYEQCFAVEAAFQRRRVHRLEDRLATLESKLA